MEEGLRLFQEKNIRITPQRYAVYSILKKDTGHFTADEIHKKIKKDFPFISLATIYSILELFVKNKLASELRIEFNKSRYEWRVDEHHHFLCKKCREISDLDIPPCPSLAKREVNRNLIEKLHGYFYGICRNCRQEPQ